MKILVGSNLYSFETPFSVPPMITVKLHSTFLSHLTRLLDVSNGLNSFLLIRLNNFKVNNLGNFSTQREYPKHFWIWFKIILYRCLMTINFNVVGNDGYYVNMGRQYRHTFSQWCVMSCCYNLFWAVSRDDYQFRTVFT